MATSVTATVSGGLLHGGKVRRRDELTTAALGGAVDTTYAGVSR